MHYFKDLCFLCLVYNKNLKLRENNFLMMREEFHYFIPEHIFHNSETPRYVCNDCIKTLNKINAFRRKCLKNIEIYIEYEQKLEQYSGSHKYLTKTLTNISNHDNPVEIKSEIFETDDSRIANKITTNEACNINENDERICDEPDDKVIKSEINDFNPPTEYQIAEISNDNEVDEVSMKKIEDICIKHEINEEFIIKEDEEKDLSGIHNIVQQEPFCGQNDLCNQNVPGSSSANKNDVSICTQNQDFLQNREMIKCEKWPETYPIGKDKKIHNFIDTKKSQICDVHQKSYNLSTDTRSHKFLNTGEQSHVCDVCQRAFNRLDHLKSHKLIHTGDKPYPCDVCQKTFSRIGHLKTHRFVHTGEKPFICDVCQKAFNRLDNLKSHKLTHSDYKPHACDVCQKTFSRIRHLNTHKLSHTGEKPFVCDVCQKAFNRIDNLKIHKFTHIGDKPYACYVCQKTFRHSNNLKRHKLTHKQ